MKTIVKLSFLASVIAISSCGDANKKEAVKSVNTGIDTSNFDLSVKPTEDFYEFVNGGWQRKNTIPQEESEWGSFNEIDILNKIRIKGLLDEAAANKAAKLGSNAQKIGDFYFTALDSVNLNANGIAPLKEEFAAISAMKTTDDLFKSVAHLHTIGVSAMFNAYVTQDQKKSTEMLTEIGQGGISLPDRDYYTNKDERTVGIQDAYKKHISNMFVLLGDKAELAEKNAKTVYAIETDFAKASMTKVEMRDPEKLYHKKSVKELAALTPNFNWTIFFDANHIKNIDSVNIAQPDFLKQLNASIKKMSIEDWKSYLRWKLIDKMAFKLSDNFVNERFGFYGKTLLGIPALKPRWKRASEATDAALGDALGQLFAEKYFTQESKERVNEMVKNLIAAYRVRIASRNWMSEESKKAANLKLDKIFLKLGYPDKWKDYSTLEIKRDSYVQNFMRAKIYEYNVMVKKLGKPVDRTEWLITVPTINAYYNPPMNEIVFPAGIMQPVFFNPDADDAVNYGAMGAIIGHELTHGFDDEGSQFDADGNLKNWWTPADKANFKMKTDMLVKQFNNYIAIDSMHVNGELTLGENIADLGGLTISYYAFKKSLEGKPAPEKIDGYTAEQRFFISWAQAWRNKMRPEYLKDMLQTNPHAPENFRANGPLSNMKEFYEVFGVKEGDKMYRAAADRAEIW